jgi:transcriptional regulator with XRE-family HTH domain
MVVHEAAVHGAFAATSGSAQESALRANADETLVKRLQSARIEAGYTQLELAALVGISRARLAKIESGDIRSHDLPVSIITALAAALSVTDAWLGHGLGAEPALAGNARIPQDHPAVAHNHDIDLRTGLALLRGLRRQYVMGRLTHRQLRTVCTLAHELASTTPKEQWAIEHPTRDAGSRIQARRVFLGWTQEALAASAGLPVTLVSEIEHGVCLDQAALAAAATALDMTSLAIEVAPSASAE